MSLSPERTSLSPPSLDDRGFQDLVDDARRLVHRRCPEWSDHNISDPGITLIEAFAGMVDQLIYRLNRVPESHYRRFLELIGVTPHPPTAARAELTFWLSAPQPAPVRVPDGAEVGTVRTEQEDPVLFTVAEPLDIVPCALDHLITAPRQGAPVVRDAELVLGNPMHCFAPTPEPGDTVLFGLSDPVPRCAVLLRLDCDVRGVGVDPRDPPLVWEAWTGADWAPCALDSDATGGLNRAGDVVVHVPAGHAASVIAQQRAAWLRCRVVEPAAGQPFYSSSPTIRAAAAQTVGGSTGAVHAGLVTDEVVGLSEGVAGQRFRLRRRPVVPGADALVLQVSTGEGWQQWRQVDSFADSGPADPHFTLDAAAGEIRLGPAVREPDGTLRAYGAVPPQGAALRAARYRHGGGRAGNVAAGLLRVLRDPVPFVHRVGNRRAAGGGVDGETVAEALVRGPLSLRTRERAVTVADYEYLARQAAPQLARVRAVADPDAPGAVRVLVVPAAPLADDGDVPFAALAPAPDTLAAVTAALAERRCVGARVLVAPPYYQGVTVVAALRAAPGADRAAVRDRAREALHRYLSPLVGGAEGAGWPFGRAVRVGELHAVLQRVPGVAAVAEAALFPADPRTGDRGEPTAQIEVADTALVQSYRHQVRVD
ncbi:putative baseplate assembly protein [Pilimelia terevasa]|uniref:Putative baseplate assembly protein n=1 Tax=Pilimelia terevasa TaxID=53372 RepID=A0A8J3BI74_9ACTN|nr:putative baseplate assembly protein [Pilimelia terevasa]GGK23347.1 putative baseplate assembly protein [Pilimelia terevasa]